MKTLISKHNPSIRITAPEVVKVYDKYYYIIDVRLQFLQENWTLVEEENMKTIRLSNTTNPLPVVEEEPEKKEQKEE